MKNKVIIITGASSGIGKALAFALAKKGNKLVLAGRNKEKLNAVLQKINELKEYERLVVKLNIAKVLLQKIYNQENHL